MMKLNKFFLFISFLTVFSGCAVSQQPRSTDTSDSSLTVKKLPDFVSEEGGFTVALSSNSYISSSTRTAQEYKKNGTQYKWDNPKGFFTITFADLIETPKDAKSFIKFTSDEFIKEMTFNGGKLISTRELSMDGNPGIEGRILLKQGSVGLYRYYVVKNRVYSIMSGWNKGESGERQLKILDSFQLLNLNK